MTPVNPKIVAQCILAAVREATQAFLTRDGLVHENAMDSLEELARQLEDSK